MMNNWKVNYLRWASFASLDPELKKLLNEMKEDEAALEDCFYKDIEFGTGGMRGELGPGTNRINLYTIRKASAGLARYILLHGTAAKEAGVAIAYDCRRKSHELAVESAKVLGMHGIRVYLFDRLAPTPLLSFAVRHLKTWAGIVITASHNPPEYNGYKVYGPDGGQLTPAAAGKLTSCIEEVGDALKVEVADLLFLKDKGLLTMVATEIFDAYLQKMDDLREKTGTATTPADQISIVFTPLHGTTREPISQGLKHFGYERVTLVSEQAHPDSEFSTVASPNPEDHAAFELAIRYAKKEDADLVLGTDPDGDRLGAAVKNQNGEYIVLNGNQTGVLLLDYLLSQKQKNGLLPANGLVLQTIVTSEMGKAVAKAYGVATESTLTGFKYIGEKMGEYEKSGAYSFLFGYEESHGYLIGDFVRDKDAIQTALLLADACAYHKHRGSSLYNALQDLYEKYGYYREDLYSMTARGKQGIATIDAVMTHFRQSSLSSVCGKQVLAVEDYLTGSRQDIRTGTVTPLALPFSNVIKFLLEDDAWFCVRPSGTEPKMKVYLGVRGSSHDDGAHQLTALKQAVIGLISEWTGESG